VVTVLRWLTDGEAWSQKKFVAVSHRPALTLLGLDPKENLLSPVELANAPGLATASEAMNRKSSTGAKLTAAEQALSRTLGKVDTFQSIATGAAWTLVPATGGWLALGDERAAESGLPQLFSKLLDEIFHEGTPVEARATAAHQLTEEILSRQALLLLRAEKATPTTLPDSPENPVALTAIASRMNREVHYNELRPFQKSWILYLVAFLLMVIGLGARTGPVAKFLPLAGLALGAGAFGLHTYGFILRCLLTGRPPVTNMYESTVWVPWGVVLFSIIISVIHRKHPRVKAVGAAAAAVASLALLMADSAPAVLDPTIKPLEPVLRSNYWLTIHVLTITLSYGAFALSLGLGNLTLFLHAFRPKLKEAITHYTQFTYRAVQFGVVLLAAGTILGGVWADYSWGRFWGWDPKETWALIALLFYIAVLHGKWAGWLKPFGLVLATVLCFNGVLMAWYGVNFVLGVGLHSYGFGAGGLEYVGAFVVAQVLGCIAVGVINARRKQGTTRTAPSH
jgi:ABC-type transport system involved in cytochrome c biogenesis permease subunit